MPRAGGKSSVCAAALVAAFLCLAPRPSAATVIGIIYPECCEAYEKAVGVLKDELLKGGYGEGSAEIYDQKPSSDPMSWSNAFRKFVGVDADLIIVIGDELLHIACREKTRIPVLFGFASDPAGARCIRSEESPGGNVTGISGRTPMFTLLDKSMEFRGLKTLGVFHLQGDALSLSTLKEIESYEEKLGYRVVNIETASRKGLSEALQTAPVFDMLFFPNFSAGVEELREVARVAASRKIPTVSLRPSESGVYSLLNLYPDPEEQGRLMGRLAVQLLKGASPSKTRVQSPKKIELEVNLGLARQYGLKVPMAVLNTATRVTK